jgi:hypothetical protein
MNYELRFPGEAVSNLSIQIITNDLGVGALGKRLRRYDIKRREQRYYGAVGGEVWHYRCSRKHPTGDCPMRKANDMSRCLAAFNQDSTLVAAIELGSKSWLVAAIVPGIERHPLKKLKPNEGALLALLYRWCEEARKAGHPIKRVCVAFEALAGALAPQPQD